MTPSEIHFKIKIKKFNCRALSNIREKIRTILLILKPVFPLLFDTPMLFFIPNLKPCSLILGYIFNSLPKYTDLVIDLHALDIDEMKQKLHIKWNNVSWSIRIFNQQGGLRGQKDKVCCIQHVFLVPLTSQRYGSNPIGDGVCFKQILCHQLRVYFIWKLPSIQSKFQEEQEHVCWKKVLKIQMLILPDLDKSPTTSHRELVIHSMSEILYQLIDCSL